MIRRSDPRSDRGMSPGRRVQLVILQTHHGSVEDTRACRVSPRGPATRGDSEDPAAAMNYAAATRSAAAATRSAAGTRLARQHAEPSAGTGGAVPPKIDYRVVTAEVAVRFAGAEGRIAGVAIAAGHRRAIRGARGRRALRPTPAIAHLPRRHHPPAAARGHRGIAIGRSEGFGLRSRGLWACRLGLLGCTSNGCENGNDLDQSGDLRNASHPNPFPERVDVQARGRAQRT
jgi:hypothetical protein